MIIAIDASRANAAMKTGVEWYAWSVIQELKKCIPADVQVVLYSAEPLTTELADLPPNWRSRVLRWPPRRLWTQVRLSCEMLLHPPTVLFVPAHVVPIIHPRRSVMVIHDIAALHVPESYSRFERWYSLAVARYAARHLWRVIVPSESVRADLAAFVRVNMSQVRVVPHGYDEAFGQPSPTGKIQAVRRAYHLDRPYLLSIGRVEEKKNSAALIRAWDRLQTMDAKYKEFDLVCIGKPGFGYDAVMTAVAESPYKDRIRLLGWVPAEDTHALLHDAQAVIFPSRYEGFGIPLLEAMASSVPVVAVRGSGAVEEVGGDAVQYAVNHSPEAIASATHELLIDRALVDSLIDRGERRVRNFSWRRAAEETWKVLSQLY